MRPPRIGSLFSGYGGLDAAAEAVFGGETVWLSDIDKGACKVLAHRYPGIPNLGDITAVDWSAVESVDIITGGSPCQDLSHAGKRQGMTAGTRSNLWVAMREAIATIRPALVVWENVAGAYSAAADSEMEPCPGCVGDGRRVHLRALGRVLGDLASLGYDARWHGLRAADVGAPHGRARVFLLATDTQHAQLEGVGRLPGLRGRPGPRPNVRMPGVRTDLALLPIPTRTDATNTRITYRSDADNLTLLGALLPTPRATDGIKGDPGQRGSSEDLMLPSAVALLPTPAVNDMGEGKTPDAWDEWTDAMQARHGNGNGHGKSLAIEAQRLLPTPNTMDGLPARSDDALARARTVGGCANLKDVRAQEWGDYAAAIARWERILGRSAPAPTQTSAKGTPQLSARFTEWLMGLPGGWVTDVPGITRNEALRLCGNGVVPQQAEAALREMLAWEAVA